MVQLCNYVTKQTKLFLLWIMNHEILIAQFKLWEQSQLLLSWGFIKACIFKYSKYFDKLCRQTDIIWIFSKTLKAWAPVSPVLTVCVYTWWPLHMIPLQWCPGCHIYPFYQNYHLLTNLKHLHSDCRTQSWTMIVIVDSFWNIVPWHIWKYWWKYWYINHC